MTTRLTLPALLHFHSVFALRIVAEISIWWSVKPTLRGGFLRNCAILAKTLQFYALGLGLKNPPTKHCLLATFIFLHLQIVFGFATANLNATNTPTSAGNCRASLGRQTLENRNVSLKWALNLCCCLELCGLSLKMQQVPFSLSCCRVNSSSVQCSALGLGLMHVPGHTVRSQGSS